MPLDETDAAGRDTIVSNAKKVKDMRRAGIQIRS